MTTPRAAYLGPRLRRLRRNLGLTQPAMATDLGVSVSYVSLIESNQRPLTADMLLRLARTYKIDLSDFAGDAGESFGKRLQEILRDPLFADIDIPALQASDVATNYPGITEALLRLHTAYREEQRALADRGASLADGSDPALEVRRFLAAHRNSFPVLDDAGERLATATAEAGGQEAWLKQRHRLRVRPVPPAVMGGMIRRHDPHREAIFLDDTLAAPTRRFQLATQIAYLECKGAIDALLGEDGFGDNGRRLAYRALATYTAAAMVMPYEAFSKAAETRRYDVDALARLFDVSFEQVAHRLTTLHRAGQMRVPFSFLRIDAAGNISKRYNGAEFPFAGDGGGCPLWNIHHAHRTPTRTVTQWLEMPDGRRFVSIARAVATGGGAHGVPLVERTVALICDAAHAHHLVYRDDVMSGTPTPIGITCTLCQRDLCPSRTALPIGRHILPDDYHRGRAPFGFADDRL